MNTIQNYFKHNWIQVIRASNMCSALLKGLFNFVHFLEYWCQLRQGIIFLVLRLVLISNFILTTDVKAHSNIDEELANNINVKSVFLVTTGTHLRYCAKNKSKI